MQLEKFKKCMAYGTLGFYRSCEVTICALLDHSGQAHNLFTEFTFEEKEYIENEKPRFLTKKNECFGDRLRLIVAQYSISTDNAFELYSKLKNGEKNIKTPFGILTLSELDEIPTAFVPIDSTETIQINRILKNNFCGGSTVFEFFARKKDLKELIGEEDTQKASERILEILPIDLFTLSDHVGNILFQFPSQIAFCDISGNDGKTECTVFFDERVEKTKKYAVKVTTYLDNILFDYQEFCAEKDGELKLTLEDTGGPYVITVTDTESGLPVLHQTTALMRYINGALYFEGNADCMRTVTTADKTNIITINSAETIEAGKPESPWKEELEKRRYRKRMSELETSREFIRYGKGQNDREKALSDIRGIMNARPKTKVCLWDPYLSSLDLLETWYFTTTYGLELRAITSSEIAKRSKLAVGEWITEQQDILKNSSNQYGINLKWRIQHDMFGFPFHDRFLILLPSGGETPKAWSLGTSVNSLGKTHHILQLVSNPGYIADAFEELWAALEDSSCQIWNGKEKHHE